jgi:hypothetical protein
MDCHMKKWAIATEPFPASFDYFQGELTQPGSRKLARQEKRFSEGEIVNFIFA